MVKIIIILIATVTIMIITRKHKESSNLLEGIW